MCKMGPPKNVEQRILFSTQSSFKKMYYVGHRVKNMKSELGFLEYEYMLFFNLLEPLVVSTQNIEIRGYT